MAEVPPVPDFRVPEFDSGVMTVTWRSFWVKLRAYLVGTPNGAALQASTSYANDAAAAAGGVPIGGWYRNQTGPGVSVIQVRTS